MHEEENLQRAKLMAICTAGSAGSLQGPGPQPAVADAASGHLGRLRSGLGRVLVVLTVRVIEIIYLFIYYD